MTKTQCNQSAEKIVAQAAARLAQHTISLPNGLYQPLLAEFVRTYSGTLEPNHRAELLMAFMRGAQARDDMVDCNL